MDRHAAIGPGGLRPKGTTGAAVMVHPAGGRCLVRGRGRSGAKPARHRKGSRRPANSDPRLTQPSAAAQPIRALTASLPSSFAGMPVFVRVPSAVKAAITFASRVLAGQSACLSSKRAPFRSGASGHRCRRPRCGPVPRQASPPRRPPVRTAVPPCRGSGSTPLHRRGNLHPDQVTQLS